MLEKCDFVMGISTCQGQRDGLMDGLRFYYLFKSISVISGWWEDDHERLCSMKPIQFIVKKCVFQMVSNSHQTFSVYA